MLAYGIESQRMLEKAQEIFCMKRMLLKTRNSELQ